MNSIFTGVFIWMGLVLILVGTIMGIHEDAYIGLGCVALGLISGVIQASFNTLFVYLEWVSAGVIKKRS